MNSRLFIGDLYHARRVGPRRDFRYPVHMMWLDVDELNELDADRRWFGHNRPGIFSLYDRDYLGPGNSAIKEKLRRHVLDRNISLPDGRVMVLTSPRYLNYAFNPVSFYFVLDAGNQILLTVAEVNNTFDEKHLYVLDDSCRIATPHGFRYSRAKQFHVSPFFDRAGTYDFLFRFPEGGIDISIDLIRPDGPAFHARLNGKFLPLSNDSLGKLIIQYPMTGLLTMTRIVSQAAKLYMRGAPVYERPTPESTDTIGRRESKRRVPFSARVVLNALEGLSGRALDVQLPDGTTRRLGDASSESLPVRFHDWRAFRRILTDGDIGLGETYMNGDWTTPDLSAFMRLLVRNRDALDAVEDGRPLRRWLYRISGWLLRNTPRGSRRNIASHYDLSNEFFSLFLDPSMTYSSAFFETNEQSLEEAQESKYRRLCGKIGLADGDQVLEIGCGWGGFACFAARSKRCKVTAVTISKRQYEYARARVEREGLSDQVEIVLKDYRSLYGQYDKIVSIEMFEAVGYKYYRKYFSVIERLLKPEGLFAMQVISIPDQEFAHYRRTYDWIRKYIFPGGMLPSLTSISHAAARGSKLVLHDLENIGTHYAETLRRWRNRFNNERESVRALGFDIRFERMWKFYLTYCEAAFDCRYLGNLQLVFARPQLAAPPSR